MRECLAGTHPAMVGCQDNAWPFLILYQQAIECTAVSALARGDAL